MKRVVTGVPFSILCSLALIGSGAAGSTALRLAGHPYLGGAVLSAAACLGGILVCAATRRWEKRRETDDS